jgi:hypothetical protein
MQVLLSLNSYVLWKPQQGLPLKGIRLCPRLYSKQMEPQCMRKREMHGMALRSSNLDDSYMMCSPCHTCSSLFVED